MLNLVVVKMMADNIKYKYEILSSYFNKQGKSVEEELRRVMAEKKFKIKTDAILWTYERVKLISGDEATTKEIDLISTRDVKSLDLHYDFDDFNPMQSKVLDDGGILKGENIIVAAPTGSGKSALAEVAIAKCIQDWKTAVYLTPLKSLAEEKLDDWKKLFPKAKIAIVTGDYELSDKQLADLKNTDIIIMTIELFNSRCVKHKHDKTKFLESVGCVIIDEAHTISARKRGDKLEVALMEFTEINPAAQLVLLSATLSNLSTLQDWIFSLTGRSTKVITSNWRPVKLNIHYEYYRDESWNDFETRFDKIKAIIKKYPKDKYLIFSTSRGESADICRLLKDGGYNIELHNATLEKSERADVEKRFREGDLQMISCTTTLSLGINIPARRVILSSVYRGRERIESLEVIQCCGRAGRIRFDKEGDAHILIPTTDDTSWMERVRLESVLLDDRDLMFHLNNLIYRGIKNKHDISKWWNRTLAYRMGNHNACHDALQKLLDLNCIAEDGDNYCSKPLGEIAARLYFYPDDVFSWHKSFNELRNIKGFDDDVEISKAFVHPSQILAEPYVSKKERKEVEDFINKKLNGLATDKFGKMVMRNWWCLTENGMIYVRNAIRADLKRWIHCIKRIAEYSKWDDKSITEIDKIGFRMLYGIEDKMVDLVKIVGVGNKRANELWDIGIKNADDIIKHSTKVSKMFHPYGIEIVENAKNKRFKQWSQRGLVWGEHL